ncbi:hypothetical protein WBJ53_25330 [Spirosoma sp. SC4-14]|uniref:hypothetical protein n=1 Tax=Spirosoma sp. SC4-14 TaxID=3128900 RepID=UPI0030D1988F
MQTKVEAFDNEIGRDIIPVNLPKDYKPVAGQLIETTDGMYVVKGYVENNMNGFISRISLIVRKAQ